MTLSGRNTTFKAGIALSAVCLLLAFVASFEIIPVYASIDTENAHRPDGFFQEFISMFLKANFYAVYVSLVAVILYSLASIILIYVFFEKTQTPEIFFVALFSLSFSLEVFRLIVPLHLIHEIPSLYLLMSARILLFGRYLGIFSLFTASIIASGFDVQKYRNCILIIVVSTMIIALGVSIDTQTWDTSFFMINGYTSLFRLVETITLFATVISFLIAAHVRGSRNYIFTGIGALLALTGRILLFNTDTWVSFCPGILFLAAGTWFICTSLHRIYLWL